MVAVRPLIEAGISPMAALAASSAQALNPLKAVWVSTQPLPVASNNNGLVDGFINQQAAAKTAYELFYKKALQQSQTRKARRLTQLGQSVLETVKCLSPKVSTLLNTVVMQDSDLGDITGKTILSLIKEGSQQRPNCVLTSHYLSLLIQQNTELPENIAEMIQALETAGLISTQTINDTQLLNPKSAKKAGQEAKYHQALARLQAQQPSLGELKQTHQEALSNLIKNLYVLDVVYLQDKQLGPISGWELLGLLLQAQQALPGDVPKNSILGFFKPDQHQAVENGLRDLSEKIELLIQEEKQNEHYIKAQPYAALCLAYRRN